MKISQRTFLPVFLLSIILQPHLSSAADASFASSEHVILGNQITLPFPDNETGKSGTLFHLPNGLNFSYGEILTIGDFYGIVDQPISQGKTASERRARFINSFSTFAYNPDAKSESKKIMAVIHNEMNAVEEGMKRGENPEDILSKMSNDNDRQYNCITGGGCTTSAWWLMPGRYMNLLNSNYDHFGDHAYISYLAGHQVALAQAAAAHVSGDIKQLELAYAMNAFASHFLSDRFASGHIRVPRLEMVDHVTPGTIGSLLSSYMHEEESQYGLHVYNARGDTWMAYGDKYYFSPQSEEHRRLLHEALQESATQIYTAYQTGSADIPDQANKLLPMPIETNNAANMDISPLFYWDKTNNKLMRRTTTANIYDKHWTSNWWGWSTLLQIRKERGMSDMAQALLAKSELGKQAVRDGLITKKEIIEYVNQSS